MAPHPHSCNLQTPELDGLDTKHIQAVKCFILRFSQLPSHPKFRLGASFSGQLGSPTDLYSSDLGAEASEAQRARSGLGQEREGSIGGHGTPC